MSHELKENIYNKNNTNDLRQEVNEVIDLKELEIEEEVGKGVGLGEEEVGKGVGLGEEEVGKGVGWGEEESIEMIYEKILREKINSENVCTLSMGDIKKAICKKLGIIEESIKNDKQILNNLVSKIVEEFDVGEKNSGKKNKKRKNDQSDSDKSDDKKNKKNKIELKEGTKKFQINLMTKKQFIEDAETFKFRFADLEIDCPPKEFSTGSCGWGYSNKTWINVGDIKVNCQLTINCTVLGSKLWNVKKK